MVNMYMKQIEWIVSLSPKGLTHAFTSKSEPTFVDELYGVSAVNFYPTPS